MALSVSWSDLIKHPEPKNKQPLKQDDSNKKGLNRLIIFSCILQSSTTWKCPKNHWAFSNWMNLSMALSVIIFIFEGAAKIPNHLRYNHLRWPFHCIMPAGVCSCPLPNAPVLQWRQKNNQTLVLQIPGYILFKTKPTKNKKNRSI